MKRNSIVPPLRCRELKAMIELKHLDLRGVAKKAGLNYSVASAVLGGRTVNPDHLNALSKVISAAPQPKEALV